MTGKQLYRGNTAYDLFYAQNAGVKERTQQPDPLARPRKRTKAKSRAVANLRVRKQQRISPMAIAGFFVAGAFAVVLLMSYAKLTAASDRVVHLKSELKDLQAQEEVLQAKYERTFDLNAIEASFTEAGAMAKPRADQIVYVDMSEPDSAQVIQSEEDTTASKSVKNFFAMAVEYFR